MSLGSGESERKVEIHEKLTASERVWHFKKFPKLTIDDIEFELTPESKKLFERGKPNQGYLAVGEIMPDGKIKLHLRPAFSIQSSHDPDVKGIGDRPELMHRPIKPKDPTKEQQLDKDFMEKYHARMKEWQIKHEEYQKYLKKDKEWMAKWEAWTKKPQNFVDKDGVPYASNEFVVTGDANVKGNTGIGHKRMIKILDLSGKSGIQSELIGFGVWKGEKFVLKIFADRSLSQNGHSILWHDQFFKQYVYNGMEMYGIADRTILERSIGKMKLPAFVICANPPRKYIIDQNKSIVDCGSEIDNRIIGRLQWHESNLPKGEKNQLISYEKFSNLKAMVELSDNTLQKSGMPPFVTLTGRQRSIKRATLFNRARSLPWALSEKILSYLLKNLPDTPYAKGGEPLSREVDNEDARRSVDMTNPIFEAAKNGELEEVQKWIEAGGSPNEIGCTEEAFDDLEALLEQNALSLIEVTIKFKQKAVFQYLFQHRKFDKEKHYTKMILKAVEHGFTEILDFLLNEPFRSPKQNLALQNALLLAAKYAQLDAVKLLLQHKADPTAKDADGNTFLHLLAVKGGLTKEILVLASQEYADCLNARNNEGYTPMHLAVIGGHIGGVIRLLHMPGVNHSARDNHGNTALHLAVKGQGIEYTEILRYLMTKMNVDINTVNDANETALHLAALNGECKMAHVLISNGADVNAENQDKETPLHLALKNDENEIAKLLMTTGADVNAVDRNDKTPLHIAIMKKQVDIVKLLLAKEADVNLLDWQKNTPLHLAVMSGKVDIFKSLIETKVDLAAVNNVKQTVLHLAAIGGHTEMVELILKKAVSIGAIDINGSTVHGSTALHFAATYGNADIVELLLDKKADINKVGNNGNTPLHFAAEQGNKEVVEVLLNRKADITAQNGAKQTALHLAVKQNKLEIVKLLVQHHPELMAIKDKERRTPLDLATDKEIANFLQSKQGQAILRFSSEKESGEKIRLKQRKNKKNQDDKPKP